MLVMLMCYDKHPIACWRFVLVKYLNMKHIYTKPSSFELCRAATKTPHRQTTSRTTSETTLV